MADRLSHPLKEDATASRNSSDSILAVEIGNVNQPSKNQWLSGLGIAVPVAALSVLMGSLLPGGGATPMSAIRPFHNQPNAGSDTRQFGNSNYSFSWQAPSSLVFSSVRQKLRTDEEARRQVLSEAIASFAFEGIQITWEDAEKMLDEVLNEPPARLTA